MNQNIPKYYTPDISEFHVGFEYEFKTLNRWQAQVFKWSNWPHGYFDYVGEAVNENKCRVKYLDQEDIESLGFARDSVYSHKYKENYYIEYNSELPIYLDTIEIYNNQQLLFSGKVKNKSELIRTLKQLGIK